MFFDAGDGGTDQPAHRIDGRETRRAFRPAAQAGSESRAFRRRRAGIEAHVLALWRTRRTNRAAVDMGGSNAHEKSPVEAAGAGAHCPKRKITDEIHSCQV